MQRADETTAGAVATRILTAWGDQDTITYHGDNFAKGQVILYGGVENSNPDPIAEITSDAGVSFFDVRAVSKAINARVVGDVAGGVCSLVLSCAKRGLESLPGIRFGVLFSTGYRNRKRNQGK